MSRRAVGVALTAPQLTRRPGGGWALQRRDVCSDWQMRDGPRVDREDEQKTVREATAAPLAAPGAAAPSMVGVLVGKFL